MKKRFISLLLVLTALISVFPVMYVKAATASERYPFTSNDIMRAGATRGVLDVNFDYGFTSIDVYLSGCSTGRQIKGDLRIDGIDGKIIGSFDYPSSIVPSYWAPVNFRVQITETVTGVHDLYLINKSGEYDPSHIMCNYIDGSKTIYKSYGDEYIFNDISGNEDAAKIEFLTQLGFFEKDERFNANVPVSRADALKTLALIFDDSEYPKVPVDVFLDVEDASVRAAAYFLYTKNILKLEDTAYLKPSEYIKVSEIAGIAANMFHYDKTVLSKITSGVSSKDGFVRKEQLADILYNIVTAKYQKIESKEVGTAYYDEYTKGILGETKEWYLSEGVVTANSYTGIYSDTDAVKDYYVRINDELYSIGKTNADTYIGMICNFIWYEDENKNITIKAIVPKYPGNISSYSNENDYESFSENGIVYTNDSGKQKKIEFSPDTKIIYNSRALPVEIQSVITDASKFRGKIIAIDNDRDEVTDVCIINNARSFVIDSISNDYLIDEISGEKFTFTEEDNIEFIRYGIKTGSEDFSVGESIDMFVSYGENDKFCQIILASEVTGAITRVSEDYIVLDGEKNYKLSPYAYYIPTAGDSGIFKLNTFGEIVYYKKDEGSLLTAGWLIKAVGNLDEEYAGMTIKTLNNEMINYTFSDNVRADGVYITEIKDLIKGKTPFVGLVNLAEQQPILYRLNDKNELMIIDTIEEGNSNIHYDQLCKILDPMASGRYMIRNSVVYTYGSRTGGAAYDDGGLAYVDESVIRYSRSELDESLSNFSQKINIVDTKANMTGYSFKKGSPKIDLFLTEGGSTGDTWLEPIVYIGKDKVSINEDHELVTTLKFETTGNPITYKVSNVLYDTDATYRAKIDGMKKGDIICGTYDSSTDQLMTLNIAHFADNEYDGAGDTRPVGETGDTFSSLLNCSTDSKAYEYQRRMMLGTVTGVEPEYIKIQRAVDTQYTEVTIPKRVTVFKIDKEGEITEISSSIAAVYEGQKVICYFKTGELSRIYIYENLND